MERKLVTLEETMKEKYGPTLHPLSRPSTPSLLIPNNEAIRYILSPVACSNKAWPPAPVSSADCYILQSFLNCFNSTDIVEEPLLQHISSSYDSFPNAPQVNDRDDLYSVHQKAHPHFTGNKDVHPVHPESYLGASFGRLADSNNFHEPIDTTMVKSTLPSTLGSHSTAPASTPVGAFRDTNINRQARQAERKSRYGAFLTGITNQEELQLFQEELHFGNPFERNRDGGPIPCEFGVTQRCLVPEIAGTPTKPTTMSADIYAFGIRSHQINTGADLCLERGASLGSPTRRHSSDDIYNLGGELLEAFKLLGWPEWTNKQENEEAPTPWHGKRHIQSPADSRFQASIAVQHSVKDLAVKGDILVLSRMQHKEDGWRGRENIDNRMKIFKMAFTILAMTVAGLRVIFDYPEYPIFSPAVNWSLALAFALGLYFLRSDRNIKDAVEFRCQFV